MTSKVVRMDYLRLGPLDRAHHRVFLLCSRNDACVLRHLDVSR